MNRIEYTARNTLLSAAILIGLAAALPLLAQDRPGNALAAQVQTLPDGEAFRYVGPDSTDAAKLWDAIWQGDAKNVVALVDMIEANGPGKDFQPRYALHGLVVHLGTPDKDAERKQLVAALASTLGGARSTTTKQIVLRELLFAGGREAIPAIGTQLLDAELCEYATQALISFGGAAAAEQLRSALPKATGSTRKTLLRGLGEVRDLQAVAALVRALGDPDRDTRIVAADALAEVGDPAAADPLLKATGANAIMEKGLVFGACLRLVRRLTEDGRTEQAEAFALRIDEAAADSGNLNVRCVTLARLAQTGGKQAIAKIAEACRSDNAQLMTIGVRSAADMQGRELVWFESLTDAAADARARFVTEVARTGNPAAPAVLLAALADASTAVRQAAIAGVNGPTPHELLAALIPFLGSPERDLREATRKAFQRVSDKAADRQLAAALGEASPAMKSEILAVLGARLARDQADAVAAALKDADAGVRVAAIHALAGIGADDHAALLLNVVVTSASARERDAAGVSLGKIARRSAQKPQIVATVIEAANSAEPAARAAAIRVLGKIADAACLGAVLQALKGDEGVRDAAVRALADWPDRAALDPLKRLAKEAGKTTHRVLALRGTVRLTAASAATRKREELLADYGTLMGMAERADEKRLVLGAVAKVEHMDALAMAKAYLQDEALRAEAEAACLTLTDRLRRNKKVRDQIRAVLNGLASSPNAKTAKRAKQQLGKLKK